jgi:hypothetical protein
VAAITTVEVLRPGLSLQRPGRSAGDYFEVKGEPRRRWWMGAAPGLERNSREDRTTKRLLIAFRVDPRDGQNHPGRPGQGRRARRGAIPGETRRRAGTRATYWRLFELRREPARETRQGVVYFDVINSLRGGESDRGGERGQLPVLSGRAWYCYA